MEISSQCAMTWASRLYVSLGVSLEVILHTHSRVRSSELRHPKLGLKTNILYFLVSPQITLYLTRRDHVDHITHVDNIGIYLLTLPDQLKLSVQ